MNTAVTRVPTLTATEEVGLMQHYGFADGHAYHDLDEHQDRVIAALPQIWRQSASFKHSQIESAFVSAFYELAGQQSQINTKRFRICTSASQSIDIVARFLAQRQVGVGLLEPTFDNLALLLRRWNVDLTSIEFASIRSLAEANVAEDLGAIFVILPNNPTGSELTEQEFRTLAAYCQMTGRVLIIDACFRFFAHRQFDQFAIMEEFCCSYIVIEDTGKTWPTQDMKASIISYSASVAAEIEDIYAEIFLCVSPFILSTLRRFIDASAANSGMDSLRRLVRSRHERLQKALEGTRMHNTSLDNGILLPVAWISVHDTKSNDLAVMDRLSEEGIGCLPGRYFYWSQSEFAGHEFIRLSLLKPAPIFEEGMSRLAEVAHRFYPL